MMDLLPLLKQVCEGDEAAWQTIKKFFEDSKLTSDQTSQIVLYVKQAAKRNVFAIYIHALLYDHGFGMKQDVEMAFLLMREAAGHGHSAASFEVGRRFMLGIGIETDYQHALQWLTLAASSPHYYPAAMYHLGLIYSQGLGVEPDSMQATVWFEQATARGYQP